MFNHQIMKSSVVYNPLISLKQKKINLLNFSYPQMRNFFITIGETPFRAEQVMRWIYHNFCIDFEKMTNLNKSLRRKLTEVAEIRPPEIAEEQYSNDGTIKWALRIGKQLIETVYIPQEHWATLCISSQAGCRLGCKFCSTAKQGFNRNLDVSEIIGQVWQAIKIINLNKIDNYQKITNVVLMGMGEPLLNLNNVVSAIKIMLDDFGFGLSKRRITISTAGIVPALDKLGDMIDVSLAISLHAPNDFLRNNIVPINKKYNIASFLDAVKRYIKKTNATQGRVTIEYVLLDHINDSIDNAYELAKLLQNIPCKINLIPWNSFPGAIYKRSSHLRMDNFFKILIKQGFTTMIRKTRGNDINASCGQLTGNIIDLTNQHNLN